jgi:hypothetical protein
MEGVRPRGDVPPPSTLSELYGKCSLQRPFTLLPMRRKYQQETSGEDA